MNGYQEQKQNQKNAHNVRVGIGKKRSRMVKKNGIPWNKGIPQTEETKKKISLANKGRKLSEEIKKKFSLAHKGKHHSPKTEFKKGHILNKGKKYSEERKRKISLAHKGKIISKETRKKMGVVFKENYKTGKRKPYIRTEHIRNIHRQRRLKQVFPVEDTKIEVKIQNFLKQLNIEFIPHKPITNIKHKYPCDIFIPSKNLIIETDGDYWHNYPIGKFMDWVRNDELMEAGFKLLRLWERDIISMQLQDFELILDEI